MPVATVSSKGQITLPARLRQKLGIKPNDKVMIETSRDTLVIKRIRDFFELDSFLGDALPESEERGGMLRGAVRRSKGGRQ